MFLGCARLCNNYSCSERVASGQTFNLTIRDLYQLLTCDIAHKFSELGIIMSFDAFCRAIWLECRRKSESRQHVANCDLHHWPIQSDAMDVMWYVVTQVSPKYFR